MWRSAFRDSMLGHFLLVLLGVAAIVGLGLRVLGLAMWDWPVNVPSHWPHKKSSSGTRPTAPSLGYEGRNCCVGVREAAITEHEWEPAIGITVSVLIYALMWAVILWLTWKVGLVAT